ncbi:MAG: hypothetical protein AAGA72_09965 [Pseudomonadota bacterium]
MDQMANAREQVVEAFAKLDDTIEPAMLAQAPSSGVAQVETGLQAFRDGLLEILTVLDIAEASPERAKRNRS